MHVSGPRREIVGLAPDGIAAVQIFTPNHKSVRVKVRQGVFVRRDNIPASPQSVTLLP
ncbi:MAG TPA: hypothetical protein VI039_07500 [Solirubrobacterales bacterium]